MLIDPKLSQYNVQFILMIKTDKKTNILIESTLFLETFIIWDNKMIRTAYKISIVCVYWIAHIA